MAYAHELAAMRRAIAISAQGLGSASPNPPVGCVILDRDGRTVGEGYHVRKGESHAEVNALTAAGERAEGGTAVVTLEPCNHYGRTPPCREALIKANVARVVIAVMDPTSRGEGGAALLRKAGIDVEQNFLTDEALLVLGPWLSSLTNDRPFITWVYEAGPDGKPFPHLTPGLASEEVQALRESHDIVIRQDGEIKEGRPKSHGKEVFQLPHGPLGETASEAVSALAGTGARSVLIEGISQESDSIIKSGLINQVIGYLPHTSHSWSPQADDGQAIAIPNGYRLTEVDRRPGYIRVVGRLA